MTLCPRRHLTMIREHLELKVKDIERRIADYEKKHGGSFEDFQEACKSGKIDAYSTRKPHTNIIFLKPTEHPTKMKTLHPSFVHSQMALSVKAATILLVTLALYRQDLTILGNEAKQSSIYSKVLIVGSFNQIQTP